ncbi:hypothetical protein COY90_00320 [Candidatus Roizmanbacteria bacterium CG_4_10_14_0_8_um_filter_39_9]|uniref:Glycosyl transferase family 1 domain-containing protein n=1 Tax=Candidatus Roizmanbacteria bacterium CG_4_10_14_0_8_um_filter_39_9 TaxID=1974829 RepID=A0A2M7QE59_9BACT|nr:MAG: hypothetical protein COY90_00320 [Candidatus Roizmanbacteria bacterium CG_4_10_14_0_8_um_filter_39_9]
MKKIGIDVRLYRQTGVGTYLRNYLHWLLQKENPLFSYHLFALPQDALELQSTYPGVIIHEAPYLWHSVKEQTSYYIALEKQRLDLMHFTYFGYPILYKRPFVTTIHDMTPLFFKTGKSSTQHGLIYELKHRAFQYVLKSQVTNSKAIITPTKTIRNQLLSYYGMKYKSKIFPIYEGMGYELTQSTSNDRLKSTYPFPFYIYVGNFYPHKNINRLIEVFSRIQGDSKLVLVGPDDYFAKSLKTSMPQSDNIRFYHNPTFSDLVFFYMHAKALIHPSLSEGFGLPIIEAAYYNCSIIASDIDVFKELLADHYISFNPFSIDHMSQVIQFFDGQKKERPDYNKLLDHFSFKEMTAQTEMIYRNILK